MCDPLTAIAIAASVAGTAYNSNQQAANIKRQVQARNDAASAEMIRQKAFQEESDASMKETRAPFEGQKQMQALGQNVQQRESAANAAIEGVPKYEAPVSGSAPQVVKTENARQLAKGTKAAKAETARGARITGLGDLFFNNNLGLVKGRRDLGMITDMSGRSASLLPFEQQVAANNATKAPGMFGDLLKTAGTAAGLYSFMGGGPTWGQLFGKTVNTPAMNIASYGSSTGPGLGVIY